MDINVVRETVTVLSFVSFAGIVAWVVSPGNSDRFEEASRQPLEDEEA